MSTPDTVELHAGPELSTLTVPAAGLASALASNERRGLETVTLPHFLPRQRWFGAKDSTIRGIALQPLGELAGGHALAVADVTLVGDTQRYLLPLSASWDETAAPSSAPVLARLASDAHIGVLIDSAVDPEFDSALLQAMQAGTVLAGTSGEVIFEAMPALATMTGIAPPRPLGAEQSNVSIAFGEEVILKLYRRLRAGRQPDVEVARFLTETGHFANTPQFLGEVRHLVPGEDPTTIAAAFAFVRNQGDAWSVTTEALFEDLKQSTLGAGAPGAVSSVGALLGQRTAEMHRALAAPTSDPDFAVDPLTRADVLLWSSQAIVEAESFFDRLSEGLDRLPAASQAMGRDVLQGRNHLIERLGTAADMTPSGGRSRIHGDYHLGQVLVADGDYFIIDFEGEPRRSLKERRAKSSPIRDVAGMLRSFHYAAFTALNRHRQITGGDSAQARADAWRQQVSNDYVRAYGEHIAGVSSYPDDPAFAQALLDLFLLQKAIYEVGYELANRPTWVEIPLSGVRDLLHLV